MKKLIIFFIFTCAILIPDIRDCYGQGISWQRLYNTPVNNQSVSKATCMADNGNFYSGGTVLINNQWDIYVMKLNPLGDTIWTRIIDTLATEVYAMTSTGDGGCVVVGDNHFSIKFDSMGNIVWAKYYGGGGISLYDLIKTTDGGYAACGELFDVGSFTSNGYLMKLDLNGNMEWQQTYPSNNIKILNSIVETPSGNFAITGTNSDFIGDTLKILFLKCNIWGNIYSDKRYTILNKASSGRVIGATNSMYIIGGGTSDSTGSYANTFFMRIDTSGNLLFAKRYNANRNQGFYDLKVINSNKYIFTRTRSFDNMPLDSYVMLIDSLGNTFDEQSFSLPEFVIFRSILLMPNGDFIFAGNGRNTLQSPYKTFIVRTDSSLYAPPIGISNIYTNTPENFILKQNYPNPFNPVTDIKFDIAKSTNVKLTVVNLLGQEVEILVNQNLVAGSYTADLNGSNSPSGVYFYKLVAGEFVDVKKMVLLK